MRFLPDDYEAPITGAGNFMRLQDGENRFRILSHPILGWEDWIDNKPIRFRMANKPKAPHDAKKPVRHFWAFIVWNYNESRIQVFHLTQATIRKSIEALCNDKDWGAPFDYDIKIVKTGQKTDTEYMVNPLPHKPITPEVIKAFNERPCNLEALFNNGDPFAYGTEHTPLAGKSDTNFSQPKVDTNFSQDRISKEEAESLLDLLLKCSPEYQNELPATLLKMGVNNFYEIPVKLFDKVSQAIVRKQKEYNEFSFDQLAM